MCKSRPSTTLAYTKKKKKKKGEVYFEFLWKCLWIPTWAVNISFSLTLFPLGSSSTKITAVPMGFKNQLVLLFFFLIEINCNHSNEIGLSQCLAYNLIDVGVAIHS